MWACQRTYGKFNAPPSKKNIEMTGTSDQPMESQLSIIGFDLIWKIQLTNLKFYFFSGISFLYLFIPASILEQKYLTFPIHKLKNA